LATPGSCRVQFNANALDMFAQGREFDGEERLHIITVGQRQFVQLGGEGGAADTSCCAPAR